MDPLLIDLSCTQFYVSLQCLNILKYSYLSNVSRTLLKKFTCYVMAFLRVKLSRGVVICFPLLVLIRDMCVAWVYVVGFSGRLCVLMGEMEWLEFWPFCVEFILCGYTLLVLMAMCRYAWMVDSFWQTVVGSLAEFLFSVLFSKFFLELWNLFMVLFLAFCWSMTWMVLMLWRIWLRYWDKLHYTKNLLTKNRK
jgi:hypothetical protein